MRNFEAAPLERLIAVAKSDTGQSKKVAAFLLAWWNAPKLGGFDLTDIWSLDQNIRLDIIDVCQFIAENHGVYPDRLGYADDFQKIIAKWRPEVLHQPNRVA